MDIVKSRRTIRFFRQDPISDETLLELVDAGRLAPSASNLQPLEYIVINTPVLAANVYAELAWAAYIQPARNAAVGQRPVAYIVVLRNQNLEKAHFGIVDAAAAIESMILTAWSKGIGSCWLASVNRENIAKLCSVPANYTIDSVVALGYPDEQPKVEPAGDKGIAYYLDSAGVLHVPKRSLEIIAHLNAFGTRPQGNSDL